MAKIGEDCYYYFYSTCAKGPKCVYRHCEAAKGSEIVCDNWVRGKCLKQNCQFRHAVIDKPRSLEPCYWEKQPGGCQKPHCVFKHSNPKHTAGGQSPIVNDSTSKIETSQVISSVDAQSIDGTQMKDLRSKLIDRLIAGTDESYVSDSELSRKRKRIDDEDLVQTNVTIKKAGPDVAHSEKVTATTSQRKICLRKPTLDSSGVLPQDQMIKNQTEELSVKKRRMWRRKSASPNLKTESPVEPDSTCEQESQAKKVRSNIENDSDLAAGASVVQQRVEAEKKTPNVEGIDEEYKSKLIDIFGPNLADMYLRQGIKLDLSHYPSK